MEFLSNHYKGYIVFLLLALLFPLFLVVNNPNASLRREETEFSWEIAVLSASDLSGNASNSAILALTTVIFASTASPINHS